MGTIKKTNSIKKITITMQDGEEIYIENDFHTILSQVNGIITTPNFKTHGPEFIKSRSGHDVVFIVNGPKNLVEDINTRVIAELENILQSE